MARKGSKSTGKLARNLALGCALAGLVGGLLVTVALVQNLSGGITDHDVLSRGWKVGFGMSLLVAAICGGAGWMLGGKVGSRITDIGLAVSKLGRGGSEVRVRVSGDDEVGALGRSVQYLANDLAELLKNQDDSGGAALVSMDPLVKQLRDKTVPQRLPAVAGYEVDGALSAGSRGGLDYFDIVVSEGEQPQSVAYLVSAEGRGALSVLACRLARDELHRALQAGATPRKALAHTNKVCKTNLPSGCCAKATLLQISTDGAKLYQAGARLPLLICQRGEVLELNAEGIAIGLDDGPVFEKSLRPQEIVMSPGTRLVLGNDAMHRAEGLLDLLRQHSPRHTNMFMNVVLGGIEQDAGEDGLREDVVLMTVKRAGHE
ncbi:MAG TPA: SpoIIE family protein phosphatase [Planctomycetota bacterium]|nr:SpoIIE family protein phosphatase [Planctomycetota bacterium]